MGRIDVVCERCGGREITRDANAMWDVDRQDWTLTGVMDAMWCETCEGECRVIDIEVSC